MLRQFISVDEASDAVTAVYACLYGFYAARGYSNFNPNSPFCITSEPWPAIVAIPDWFWSLGGKVYRPGLVRVYRNERGVAQAAAVRWCEKYGGLYDGEYCGMCDCPRASGIEMVHP